MSCSHSLLLFIFIYWHACTHHSTHVDIRGQSMELGLLFYHCVSQGSNSGFGHQVSSATQPSPCPSLLLNQTSSSSIPNCRSTPYSGAPDPVHFCLFWRLDTPSPSSYLGECHPQDASLLGFTRTLKPALSPSDLLTSPNIHGLPSWGL